MPITSSESWIKVGLFAGRVLLLTMVTFVLFVVAAVVSGIAEAPPPGASAPAGQATAPPQAETPAPPDEEEGDSPQEEAAAPPREEAAAPPQDEAALALALLAVCFLISLAVAPVVQRSRWHGWRPALALFVLLFGEMTILSQVETVVYLTHVSREFLTKIVLFGFLLSVTLGPTAVLIFWRVRKGVASPHAAPLPAMSWGAWTWRFAAVAVVHIAAYYYAGYYVAWKNPAVRAYYGGSDPGSFLAQLQSILQATPWMVPFQLGRGVLWALLAVLLVRMVAGPRLGVAVIAALFLGLVGPCQLLLPNPLMPVDVRMAHMVETMISRVLFGLLAVWLLYPPRKHLAETVSA